MMISKLIRLPRRQLHTIICRETIKPSSSTPSHLKTYNLSSLDQLAVHEYAPLILFYPKNANCRLSAHDKISEMKKSLSHSLTRYYPFAGRLHTPTSPYVDCTDEGVVFVEAQNDSQLKTLQHISEQDQSLDHLFADGLVWDSSPRSTNILGVQVNHFACGGMGVAVSMSHIIGDGCTLGSFMNHWASVARYGSTDHKELLPLNPHFIVSPSSNSVPPVAQVINKGYANRISRKFVFPNTKLSELKIKVMAMVAAGSTPLIKNPTRVDVLTSLLYKTAMTAATAASGSFKPSYLLIPANIRHKFLQKLPETSVGNFVSVMMVPTRRRCETSLSVTVLEIMKEKSQLEGIQSVQQAAENLKSLQSKLGNENIEDVAERSYWCSSLCGFPFNKVDFGWGKPLRATLPLRFLDKIGFLLKDTPDGNGIEAAVILVKEEMEIFEKDKEMLSYSQINQI